MQDGEGMAVAQQGAELRIASADVSDAGHYVCVATSVAGEKAVQYDVNVLGTRTQTHANYAHAHTRTHTHNHTI